MSEAIPITPASQSSIAWRSISLVRRDDFDAIQLGFLQILRGAVVSNRPLANTFTALAEEYRGGARRDIRRIASQLESGVPLPTACEQCPELLDNETILTIRLGVHSGLLVPALDKLIEIQRDRLRNRATKPRVDRFYWISMAIVTLILWSGLMFFIYPTMGKMYEEFGMNLPTKLRLLGSVWNVYSRLWPFVFLALFFFFTIGFAKRWERWLFRNLGQWLGLHTLVQSPPVTLDWIALALRHETPLLASFSTMAKYHYHRDTRRRLLEARNDMELGTPTWDALYNVKLLSATELQFMKSYEDREMKAYFLEKQAQQLRNYQDRRAALRVVLSNPLLTLAFGCFVGLICIAFFEILVSLITSLT